MHSPNIMSYANSTSLLNQRYAERHSYGFHILDHVIDQTRVPHWSKMHAIQIHLPDYDFAFWIDADAAFYDQSRRIEEVLQVEASPSAEIWGQDLWPDYPSLHRKEVMDGGTFLIRNSEWSRRFLLEMYFYPPCLDVLNWTEQYCFTLAYRANLLDVQRKTVILPTPTINHHRIPPPDRRNLFILHLAGRSNEARTRHFRLVYDDHGARFQDPKYRSFWDFYQLFAEHEFGKLAMLQLCVFGLGHRQRAMIEAIMYHFPYINLFAIVKEGAPGLYSQSKESDETIGAHFGTRMAALDMTEYLTGRTRDGDELVKGFYCDVMVLSPESARQLNGVAAVIPMVRAGLEHFDGPKGTGFSISGMRDVMVAMVGESCKIEADERGLHTSYSAEMGTRLDKDDEQGSALDSGCRLLSDMASLLEQVYEGAQDADPEMEDQLVLDERLIDQKSLEKMAENNMTNDRAIPWEMSSRELWGWKTLGKVMLVRLPRFAFPA